MKRIISILLAVMLVASCTVATSALYSWFDEQAITVDQAIQNYIDAGNKAPNTYRYYFLMPNGSNGDLGDDPDEKLGQFAPSWYKTYEDGTPATSTAGIYWWDSKVADPEGWIGYLPSGKEACDSDIYYADVPTAVTGIVWNNGIDGGTDPEQPIYYCAAQTVNIGAEYYEPDESPIHYPNGTDNFNNMIFVIDPDLVSINELSGMQTCGGEWYYYYGNGCYGFTEGGDESNCLRGDHSHKSNVVVGDADGDGEVSILDATQVQLMVAGLAEKTAAADADGDGDVSIMDATQIQMMVAGLA